ncbi:MAG: hypothetical protein AAF340_01840 [Pseudomonadota bacterium]
MSEWFDRHIAAFQFLFENPFWLGVTLIVAALLYWLNTRLMARVLRKNAEASRVGWRSGGAVAARKNDSGIGMHEVIVMKLATRQIWVALWTFVFLGAALRSLRWSCCKRLMSKH